MPAIRVMFIGQGPSGLAEDRIVNVFHFSNGSAGTASAALQDTCRAMVGGFYNDVQSTPTIQMNPVGYYLSPWVSRTAELRSYDLFEDGAGPGTGIDRTPAIEAWTLPTASSNEGLPEEVAVVLTLHGSQHSSRRRRGRIYLGPLTYTAAVAATTTEASRPGDGLIRDAPRAALRLVTQSTALDIPWCIRSTVPAQNFVPILSGYMDNAFDTQRRRGPDPSLRTVFTSLP